MSTKPVPNITSLDLLRSLYSELSAPFVPYFTTIIRIVWRDGSPDTEESVVHNGIIPASKLDRTNYRGAKSVTPVRDFVEETCGSLYAPVSALGYRSFDYGWALAFKLDCDLARKKTGDPMDGAAEYISDIAANDKILKRRNNLKEAKPGGRPAMTNTDDLEERYLNKMKNLTIEERKEIRAFLKKNQKELDASSDSFMHENYAPKTTMKDAVSISAGPPGVSDDAFLSWLLESADSSHRIKPKPALDENEYTFVSVNKKRKLISSE
jgi:hypothetical protein